VRRQPRRYPARLLFAVTLERPDLVRLLTIVNEPRKTPVVLSQEEVAGLLEAAPGLKYKAAPSVTYGAGLRVSEVANLSGEGATSRGASLCPNSGSRFHDSSEACL
jgi:integrase/recombinase XerD